MRDQYIANQHENADNARMFRIFILILWVPIAIFATDATAASDAASDAKTGAKTGAEPNPLIKPRPRPEAMNKALTMPLPATRWAHIPQSEIWTRGAIAALLDHGRPLVDMVPRDIADWCPAYPGAGDEGRISFWVGFLSALAKHESTYKPRAVGGGGRWYGLLQILPSTARGYGCNARSGSALKDGAANLSCAIRIMAHTVVRDGVIAARDRKWRGVAADWGPMQYRAKRRDIAGWTRTQSYCTLPIPDLRPKSRNDQQSEASN
ncbi:MAG: lytic transglycosylase domain-containing protein [Rhodobacterales bacterium]|nr:lytic transglycosylase domain-containing protein [Rhodobacterales bacterium]